MIWFLEYNKFTFAYLLLDAYIIIAIKNIWKSKVLKFQRMSIFLFNQYS